MSQDFTYGTQAQQILDTHNQDNNTRDSLKRILSTFNYAETEETGTTESIGLIPKPESPSKLTNSRFTSKLKSKIRKTQTKKSERPTLRKFDTANKEILRRYQLERHGEVKEPEIMDNLISAVEWQQEMLKLHDEIQNSKIGEDKRDNHLKRQIGRQLSIIKSQYTKTQNSIDCSAESLHNFNEFGNAINLGADADDEVDDDRDNENFNNQNKEFDELLQSNPYFKSSINKSQTLLCEYKVPLVKRVSLVNVEEGLELTESDLKNLYDYDHSIIENTSFVSNNEAEPFVQTLSQALGDEKLRVKFGPNYERIDEIPDSYDELVSMCSPQGTQFDPIQLDSFSLVEDNCNEVIEIPNTSEEEGNNLMDKETLIDIEHVENSTCDEQDISSMGKDIAGDNDNEDEDVVQPHMYVLTSSPIQSQSFDTAKESTRYVLPKGGVILDSPKRAPFESPVKGVSTEPATKQSTILEIPSSQKQSEKNELVKCHDEINTWVNIENTFTQKSDNYGYDGIFDPNMSLASSMKGRLVNENFDFNEEVIHNGNTSGDDNDRVIDFDEFENFDEAVSQFANSQAILSKPIEIEDDEFFTAVSGIATAEANNNNDHNKGENCTKKGNDAQEQQDLLNFKEILQNQDVTQLSKQATCWGLRIVKSKKGLIKILMDIATNMPKDKLRWALEVHLKNPGKIINFLEYDGPGSQRIVQIQTEGLGKMSQQDEAKINELKRAFRDKLLQDAEIKRDIMMLKPLNRKKVVEKMTPHWPGLKLDKEWVGDFLDEMCCCWTEKEPKFPTDDPEINEDSYSDH
ncbi:hypothetical protein DAMA08_029240 [Martiniozyma asiatica (nom. inval.)]|nr:hypothetical protein DAMA08_029240 [Martiniozyma asiatica]